MADCNELNESVDGWDFKSYVLEIQFHRFMNVRIGINITELNGQPADIVIYQNELRTAINGNFSDLQNKG